MPRSTPDSILRLRAANPAPLEPHRSDSPVARAALQRLRAALAAVPDSFFIKLRIASRFGTFGAGPERGSELAPPAGVPVFLVCEQAGSSLSCQNLDGDRDAPLGAGVYQAMRAPDWRVVQVTGQRSPLPPGIGFDAAEERVLSVLLEGASTGGGSGGGGRLAAPPPRR